MSYRNCAEASEQLNQRNTYPIFFALEEDPSRMFWHGRNSVHHLPRVDVALYDRQRGADELLGQRQARVTAWRVFAYELLTGEIQAAKGEVNTCMWCGGVAGAMQTGTRPIHGKAQSPVAGCAKSNEGGGGRRRSAGCAPATGQEWHKSLVEKGSNVIHISPGLCWFQRLGGRRSLVPVRGEPLAPVRATNRY